MEFTSIVDMITLFANEYCYPASIILLVGNNEVQFIKELFEFITSDVICINDKPDYGVDIVVKETLPFESNSFDLIIDFKDLNLKKYLKPNGKLLMKGVVVDALEIYKIGNETFSVV
jgi:hypothetical protein